MPVKGPFKPIRTTSYNSPENITKSPESDLMESYEDTINSQAAFGQTKPTAEQAAGINDSELGGQYIPTKPDEPTATIDPGQGAGMADDPVTYPYPPNPDTSLGVPDHTQVVGPKLQVQGDPAETYGVRNPATNTPNFGAFADAALRSVVERVGTAAAIAELTKPSENMDSTGSTVPIKLDLGNESLNPENTIQTNPAGQPVYLEQIGTPAGDVETTPQTHQLLHRTEDSPEVTQALPAISQQYETADWPAIIAFDWNGTIDARGIGRGIPLQHLIDLQNSGRFIFIFTSSTQGAAKDFMREACDKAGIPYTDNEEALHYADIFVGDKRSDEKRAGEYGPKFIFTEDYKPEKMMEKAIKWLAKTKTSEDIARPVVAIMKRRELAKQSISIPHMTRTVIGDKWDSGYNLYENRENGVPVIPNTVTSYDLLTEALGSRGFVLNEIALNMDKPRYEMKMNGDVATTSVDGLNSNLVVTISDRTGAPLFQAKNWVDLLDFLNQRYPQSKS